MRRGWRAGLLIAGLGLTLFTLGLAPAGATSANISRSYQSTAKIASGSLVSLNSQRAGYVVPASVDNGAQLLGVASADNNSLVAVDAASGRVQVATTGTVPTLVSTLNGNIKVGDQIAVSPFNGVGMRASTSGSRVIGLAQTDFNDSTTGATAETIKTKNGQNSSVKVGYVRLNIAISTYSTAPPTNINNLQKIAKAITGHVVSTGRVVISMAVAIITVVILITLVYASIYGSLVSVGRNPLAKYAVFRTLGSVLALALLTTIISGLTIFLLLR